jgi:hypothetical protein
MATKKRKRGDQAVRRQEGGGTEESTSEEKEEMASEEAEEAMTVEAVEASLNQSEASGKQERRSSMAVDEMREERVRQTAEKAREDYIEMAKTWKDSYLEGLDACLQWQEENERLIKDTVKQGLSGSRQLLGWWKEWIDDQTQRQAEIQKDVQKRVNNQRQTNNVTNPFLGFTKQSTEAILATVEPILKNSEAAVDSTFGYYENAVAAPSRKYVRELNQQVLNAVIPS